MPDEIAIGLVIIAVGMIVWNIMVCIFTDECNDKG